MIKVGRRAGRSGLLLALAAAVVTGCATAGTGEPGEAGQRPRDDAATREAGVHLAQASLQEGDAAREAYGQALAAALNAIERDPENPRAYLLAGQAAVGTEQWVQADTMFDRAQALYPRFEEQIAAEREEAWVRAYNLGAEALSANDEAAALEYFQGADILFDGRPEARLALGMLHAGRGDTEAAIAAYRGALDILMQPVPEAYPEEEIEGWERDRRAAAFNLANLQAQAGQFDEAAEVLAGYLADAGDTLEPEVRMQAMTARAAFLTQAGRTEEADRLYAELREQGDLGADQFFQIGIGQFNAGEYEEAAESFAQAVELNPHSRDAYLNLVQSLYSAALELEEQEETPERNQRLRAMYEELIDAAEHVQEFDPLNRNLLSFTLRAYRAMADVSPSAEAERLTQMSQQVFRDYQAMEYEVSDVTMAQEGGDRARIQGVLMNLSGTPGDQVQLRFTMLGQGGSVLDTATATVTVPAVEETAQFSTTVDLSGGDLAGWRYELVD